MSVCDRLNAVLRGVFGSSRRGAQPEEQRSAAPTRRLHQKFRLELCASTNADPMARVTSAQNATSSVFFDTTHLPEAGHLFKRGLADAAWPLSAASAQYIVSCRICSDRSLGPPCASVAQPTQHACLYGASVVAHCHALRAVAPSARLSVIYTPHWQGYLQERSNAGL